jgi:pimeloyl-ACP methyl ester carboxylesterase
MSRIKKIIQTVGATSLRVVKGIDREFNDRPSCWVRKPNPDMPVIIFIHGILSKGGRAWAERNHPSWPELLAEDSRFAVWGIGIANWYSTVFSSDSDAMIESERLYQELAADIDGVSPLRAKKIVFVCHSMGGIIARQILIAHPELLTTAAVTTITLSTPAHGAVAAQYARVISAVANHAQAGQLIPGNSYLEKVHQDFMQLVKKSPAGRLQGMELVESHLIGPRAKIVRELYYWITVPQPLVDSDSQGGYFGSPIIVQETDHRSISRPRNTSAEVYRLVADFLLGTGTPAE